MRKAKYGVGAAVIVGIAWVISNMFNFGGPGGRGPTTGVVPEGGTVSSDTDASSTDSVSTTNPAAEREPEQPLSTYAAMTTDPVPRAGGPADQLGAGPVVEVLVDGRDYYLRRGTGADGWAHTDPAAVVMASRQVEGDGAGIKVRVFRKKTARASAEDQLKESLHVAGLTDAQIDWPETLLE